ncbi:phosphoribosylanthranilate isomerase [Chryseobacterium soli]|uniref:N-(5'-phosphoribosyl)anthranilate isomerase n=1 Tax=Chryseobacterium soli TaxID=445961 RepID=A0A086ADE9_9FLAO|nr:phosphoribosylanthranilate isomerase [Chryseobacterium soli]KFF14713.1 phosphoribosylanthranilate isomerase [Chryseobacterium soli]
MKPQQIIHAKSPKLKVCGLTQLDQVQELISMGTDLLGFIFYKKSPRYVLNHLHAEDLSTIDHQGKVGVFVNEDLHTITEIVQKANLNFVQLHGDENEIFIDELKEKLDSSVQLIKVIRIGSEKQEVIRMIEKNINHQSSGIDYYLFDTDSKDFGGTGKQFDWNVLNEFEMPVPYFLSGGISEDNVEHVKNLRQQPFALDINSKFEIKAGVKDVDKIKKFKHNFR